MTEDFDELAAINAELQDFYQKISEEEIPPDIRSAIEKGWELILEPVQTHIALAYPKTRQREDRKRLIPLQLALNILDQFEETLVVDHVKDPVDIVWKGARNAWATAKYFKDHWDEIWKGLNVLFDLLSDLELNLAWIHLQKLWGGIAAAVGLILFAYRKENFGLCIETVAKARNRHADRMRRGALRQLNGPRYSRRKRKRL